MSDVSVSVRNVSKRFRVVQIPKGISLKEAALSWRPLRGRPRDELFIDALKNVSFELRRGEMLGVIGRNGSGKTTLMRLLAGIYKPDSGSMHIGGGPATLLSLGLGFHPDMSGRENVRMSGLILGLSPKEIERRFDEIVDFAELRDYIDIPLRVYSSGMNMRLAFAVAITIDPEVLLLDEVMAVGDGRFVAKCLERIRALRRMGRTIVLVSHDPAAVVEWCDSALWMEAGRLRRCGSAEEVIDAYRADLDDGPEVRAKLIATVE